MGKMKVGMRIGVIFWLIVWIAWRSALTSPNFAGMSTLGVLAEVLITLVLLLAGGLAIVIAIFGRGH